MKETKENLEKEKTENQIGITLIALVVTIVVLLILAGITINSVLGDNGIFKTAREAGNDFNEAQITEGQALANLENQIGNFVNGQVGNSNPGEDTEPEVTTDITTVTDTNHETLKAKDSYGNIITVPKGFKVVSSEGTTVPEGIVIEDAQQNQFVWIPTGTYKINESGATQTNKLIRREFLYNEVNELDGDASVNGTAGNPCYGEGDIRSCTITGGVNSINAFLDSAKPLNEGGNGGFYIGRYEAGTETERTASTNSLTIPLVQANKNAYVYITRNQAKTQAEAMYNDPTQYGVTSQLISSYAWDTALNFMCQNSEHGYTLATTIDQTYANIGTRTKELTGAYQADNYSNIHDLLGNFLEFTTEYCDGTTENYQSVTRGLFFGNDSFYNFSRIFHSNSYGNQK